MVKIWNGYYIKEISSILYFKVHGIGLFTINCGVLGLLTAKKLFFVVVNNSNK